MGCGYKIEQLQHTTFVLVTAAIVAFAAFFGLVVPNLTIIIKLKGAICGMCIVYIFPATLLLMTPRIPMVVKVYAVFLMCLGLFNLTNGVWGSIQDIIS